MLTHAPVLKSYVIHLFNHLHINNIYLKYFFIVIPLLLWIGCTSGDSNIRPYDHESDAIPLSYRPLCDMIEHTHNMYENIMTKPFISKQRLSDKIWLSSIDTIYDNIISGIFSRKNIFWAESRIEPTTFGTWSRYTTDWAIRPVV